MMPAWTKPCCWVVGRIVHREINLAGLKPRDSDPERAHRALALKGVDRDRAEIRVFRFEAGHGGSRHRLFREHQQFCRCPADGLRKRRRLARPAVHVNADDLADGGDLAGLGVAHLVAEADRALADLEQAAFDLDDVAGEQFAPVGDVCCTAAMPLPESRK